MKNGDFFAVTPPLFLAQIAVISRSRPAAKFVSQNHCYFLLFSSLSRSSPCQILRPDNVDSVRQPRRTTADQPDADTSDSSRLAYRLAEVSRMIGIPASTLRTMIRRGEINPVTSFGTWLITREELDRLLSKRLR